MRARGWIIGLVVANEVRGLIMAPALAHSAGNVGARMVQPLVHASLGVQLTAFAALLALLIIVCALLGVCVWRAARTLYTWARATAGGLARLVGP